jgi:hypothetical protein
MKLNNINAIGGVLHRGRQGFLKWRNMTGAGKGLGATAEGPI